MLTSSHISAFYAVASHLSFSKAASTLHITQSAISQRIAQLEEELALALFNRHPRGISLTEAGEILLSYCRSQKALEEDVQEKLSQTKTGILAGAIRIGAYSSTLRSVVMPVLNSFLLEHPGVECEFRSFSGNDIVFALQNDLIDILISDASVSKATIAQERIGYEEYVVIEDEKGIAKKDVYLDNAPSDQVTANFFRAQKKPAPAYQRLFMHDCYGIMDGVAAGLGRAVMPAHLLRDDKRIRLVAGYKPYLVAVHLQFYKQTRYSRVFSKVIEQLRNEMPSLLS